MYVCGHGGMSTIYRARDRKVGRDCAIKQITDNDRKEYEKHKESLLVERAMLAKLTNPRIPRITDIVEDAEKDDFFYVVMDYVEGETLQHYVRRKGPQSQERVVEWAKSLCDVLRYLHNPEKERRAIIFRDMKPGNIMLKSDNDIVLFDFGIAVEMSGEYVINTDVGYTPGYAAPEQKKRGERIDQRVDIYGLGATMFSLLTGISPGSKEGNENLAHIRTIRPEIAPGLEEIIAKCTAEKPNDRYQNCAELRVALNHWTEREKDQIRKARSKLILFAATMAAAVLCFTTYGYAAYADNEQRKQNYSELISAADAAANDSYNVEEGKYDYEPQVVNRFLEAIDADPTSTDAYLKLLDYCQEAGMPEIGLQRVTSNIDSEVGGTAKNNELLYKVAKMYFSGVKVQGDSYKEAAKYFAMIDSNKIPIAAYYQRISSVLGQYNTLTVNDWKNIDDNLRGFETYLDTQRDTLERVNGYFLEANVYMINEASFLEIDVDAYAEAARLYNKALNDVNDFLKNVELQGTNATDSFEAQEAKKTILQNLAKIYLLDTPNRDLEKSENCYIELIDASTSKDDIKTYNYRLAIVYKEMKNEKKVREWYSYLMEQYPEDPTPFLEFASYLYNTQKDAEEAAKYFIIATGLEGAESIQSYKVLENNLRNAGVL